MRKLILTIKTGEQSIGTFLAYREVEEQYLRTEYRTLKTLPNITTVTVVTKPGESWPEYLSLIRSLEA